MTNRGVLIQHLEAQVRSQQRYIAELEMLVGYEKLALQNDIRRLRHALKELHARSGM